MTTISSIVEGHPTILENTEEQVMQGQYTDTEIDTDLQSSPEYAVIYQCFRHFVRMVTINKDPQNLNVTKVSC